jgi:hypothetical protein
MALGQVGVAHQVRGGDVLHLAHSVNLGQCSGELAEPAGAGRAHPGVCPAQAEPGLGAIRRPFLGPGQGTLQVLEVGQGIPRGDGRLPGSPQGPACCGHDRGGLDPDVHPDRGTRRPVESLRCCGRGPFEAHRRVPAATRVPAHGEVQYPGPAAHQQPPELGLRPARRGEGDPPVLGDPQATRLKTQTVGGREPGPVPGGGP